MSAPATETGKPVEIQQAIVPYLAYRDAPAAIDFLCTAFGFEERFRYKMPDGSIGHAELVFRNNVVALATESDSMGFASPCDLPGCHTQLTCTVDDADAHYERARAAGATCIEPQDNHGSRMYRAMDLEGHRWIFAGPLTGTLAGTAAGESTD